MNAEKLDATLLKLKEKIGIHQRLRLTTQLIDSMQAGLPEKLNLAWPNLELCQDDQLKNIIITVCQRSVLIVFFFHHLLSYLLSAPAHSCLELRLAPPQALHDTSNTIYMYVRTSSSLCFSLSALLSFKTCS